MRLESQKRQAARATGARAERLASLFLQIKLYKILARQYRVRDGEIDIIARRGRLVVFVEVKARPTILEAIESITPQKRQRMARAARRWISANPRTARCSLRADAVLLTPRGLPRHVEGIAELALD